MQPFNVTDAALLMALAGVTVGAMSAIESAIKRFRTPPRNDLSNVPDAFDIVDAVENNATTTCPQCGCSMTNIHYEDDCCWTHAWCDSCHLNVTTHERKKSN